jgi:hypothetical protein
MSNRFDLPQDSKLAEKLIDGQAKTTHMKIKSGWLGRFFGSTSNTSLYIVGLISLLLLLCAVIYTFIPDNYRSSSLSVERLWTIVLPVLTTLIGFLFGQGSRSNQQLDSKDE